MPKKQLDAALFLEGRERYLDKTPIWQIAERLDAIEEQDPQAPESFLAGFFDGALADLRDCAKNAREEMANRTPVPVTPEDLYRDSMWPPYQNRGC